MPKLVYSDEMIEYLREIVPGRYNDEITVMFNEKFDMDLTEKQIKSLRGNYKIKSGVSRRNPKTIKRLFTPEQHEYLTQNVSGRKTIEIAQLMNDRFDLSIKQSQVKAYMANHGLKNGIDATFKKGRTPINKGTKGMFNVGGNSGSFKKGQMPKNYRPVGSERIESKQGYILIKVQDEGEQWDRWRPKHVWLWEKEYGPIPEKHILIFLDSNPQNCDLSNLKLITMAQNVRMNQNGWRFDNPEATEVGATLALLQCKKASKKRG